MELILQSEISSLFSDWQQRDRLVMYGEILKEQPVICITMESTALRLIGRSIVVPIRETPIVKLDVFSILRKPEELEGYVRHYPVNIDIHKFNRQTKRYTKVGFWVTSQCSELGIFSVRDRMRTIVFETAARREAANAPPAWEIYSLKPKKDLAMKKRFLPGEQVFEGNPNSLRILNQTW